MGDSSSICFLVGNLIIFFFLIFCTILARSSSIGATPFIRVFGVFKALDCIFRVMFFLFFFENIFIASLFSLFKALFQREKKKLFLTYSPVARFELKFIARRVRSESPALVNAASN